MNEHKKFYRDGFMDLSKYRLERAAPGPEWDAFVASSPEGTVFSSSLVLGCLDGARAGCWMVRKDRQPVAALCMVESEDGRRAIENFFVVYAGLMLAPAPPEQSAAQTVAERFRIASFCAEQLAEVYDEVFLGLSPAFVDIRPFLWHNYGQEGARYVADVRFTSTMSLVPYSGEPDRDPLYLAASKSRRQQIRYGRTEGVVTTAGGAIEDFIEMYAATFARQEQAVDEALLRQLERVVRGLIDAGRAKLYLARSAEGELGSAAVFCWDDKRAYYLYGANAPQLRDEHTGTMVLWDALLDLRAQGISEVDLEGINSPLRGHFKLSFGGSVTPYYHLSLRK